MDDELGTPRRATRSWRGGIGMDSETRTRSPGRAVAHADVKSAGDGLLRKRPATPSPAATGDRQGGRLRHPAPGMLERQATTRHKTTLSSLGRHELIEPADKESTDGRAARYVAVPFCAGIYGFVASPDLGLCRSVPGRVDPRQDRRSRMDHAVGSAGSSAAHHHLVSNPAIAGPYGLRMGRSITHRSRQGPAGRSPGRRPPSLDPSGDQSACFAGAFICREEEAER